MAFIDIVYVCYEMAIFAVDWNGWIGSIAWNGWIGSNGWICLINLNG